MKKPAITSAIILIFIGITTIFWFSPQTSAAANQENDAKIHPMQSPIRLAFLPNRTNRTLRPFPKTRITLLLKSISVNLISTISEQRAPVA